MRQPDAGTSRRDFLAACGLSSSAPAIGHAAPAIIEGREIAAPRGAIATEAREAVRAGARILEAGGNAMDAADAEGNVVAATLSHGGLFGSCVTVPGIGVILGHGMCRFDPRPGYHASGAATTTSS